VTETLLVRAILQALQLKGVFCWRVNSGVTVLGTGKSKRVIRGAPAGTPDIIGALDGRMVAFEVKTETGRVLATQQRWHDKATKHGVRVAVVRSVSQALAKVKEWREGA
jgi:hypothetical protein